jgi:uncharacterized protein YprB with RNaseH-like and TPR domain
MRNLLLEHTFIHIQGIGPKKEQGLWKRGILTWADFLHEEGIVFSPARDRFVRAELETSVSQRHNIRYFRDRLSSREQWRLFEAFRERAVYLDIETSGGHAGVDEITVIGLYDGREVHTFVNGINLHAFEIAAAQYELLITFNGSSFDVPVIRRVFPGISLPPAHIDLRFLMNRLGYRGGLKKIEKRFNLRRAPDIRGLNGYDAVLLWRDYQRGDSAALKTLVRYNRADIVNLEPLMEAGYREMRAALLPSK